jgi:uncharacterized protein YcfL
VGAKNHERFLATPSLKVSNKDKILKKKYLLLIIFAFFIPDGFAAPLTKQTSCRPSVATDMLDEANQHIIQVQDSNIDAKITIYGSTIFAPLSLVAIPTINNKTGKNIHVSYHSLFYDSDGTLLSSISQESTLKPETKHMQFSSSILGISKASFDAISRCEVIFHIWEQ